MFRESSARVSGRAYLWGFWVNFFRKKMGISSTRGMKISKMGAHFPESRLMLTT